MADRSSAYQIQNYSRGRGRSSAYQIQNYSRGRGRKYEPPVMTIISRGETRAAVTHLARSSATPRRSRETSQGPICRDRHQKIPFAGLVKPSKIGLESRTELSQCMTRDDLKDARFLYLPHATISDRSS